MYAIQTKFVYGWDYVGSCGSERELYDTREEAQADLDSDIKSLEAIGQDINDWRVAEYIESDDTKDDLK